MSEKKGSNYCVSDIEGTDCYLSEKRGLRLLICPWQGVHFTKFYRLSKFNRLSTFHARVWAENSQETWGPERLQASFLMLLDVRCRFLPFWQRGSGICIYRVQVPEKNFCRPSKASPRCFTGMVRVFIHGKRKTAYRGCKRLILQSAYFKTQKNPAYTARHKKNPGDPGPSFISYSFCIAAIECRPENR